MTEYLHPGVYVEEVSYRTKVIDGVATLVVGMLIGVAVSIAIDRLRCARGGAGRGTHASVDTGARKPG
jgi:phage tail sheath protein FI